MLDVSMVTGASLLSDADAPVTAVSRPEQDPGVNERWMQDRPARWLAARFRRAARTPANECPTWCRRHRVRRSIRTPACSSPVDHNACPSFRARKRSYRVVWRSVKAPVRNVFDHGRPCLPLPGLTGRATADQQPRCATRAMVARAPSRTECRSTLENRVISGHARLEDAAGNSTPTARAAGPEGTTPGRDWQSVRSRFAIVEVFNLFTDCVDGIHTRWCAPTVPRFPTASRPLELHRKSPAAGRSPRRQNGRPTPGRSPPKRSNRRPGQPGRARPLAPTGRPRHGRFRAPTGTY